MDIGYLTGLPVMIVAIVAIGQLVLVNATLVKAPPYLNAASVIVVFPSAILIYVFFTSTVNYTFGDDMSNYMEWQNRVDGQTVSEIIWLGHPDFGFSLFLKVLSIVGIPPASLFAVVGLVGSVGMSLLSVSLRRIVRFSIPLIGGLLLLVLYNRIFIEISLNTIRTFLATLVCFYGIVQIYQKKYWSATLFVVAISIHSIVAILLLVFAGLAAVVGAVRYNMVLWDAIRFMFIASIIYFSLGATEIVDAIIGSLVSFLEIMSRSEFYFPEYVVSYSLIAQYLLYIGIPGIIVSWRYPYTDRSKSERNLVVLAMLLGTVIMFLYPTVPQVQRLALIPIVVLSLFVLMYANMPERYLYFNVAVVANVIVLAENIGKYGDIGFQ